MLKFQDLFLTSEVFTDSINEVIKTGDVTDFESLKELRDYVITPSILKTFNQFFSNYYDKATGDNIGVWISGAFGSGKSHFLHILSYLSENKTINYNGQVYQTADIFLQKLSENLQEIEADLKEKENDKNLIELQKDNLTLREYIQKLKNAKTHSILFNIQSQSETIEEKSILKPLLSMFNNFLGYYRDSIYLANFERSLDGNGLFDEFKKIYEIQNNKTWEVDRGSYLSVYSNIINAYSYVSNISEEEAKTNFDNLIKRDYFSLKSINFAELIKEYTDKTGYKLCFFIDEISQFIGSNEKLLLELQTIVEDLGSICKGNAWLVVSAQAELGELVNAKDGFSKILGRFRTQLSLTSSNMPIIIRKRILEKTPEAKMQLQTFYRNYESAIRSSTSIELKNSSSKLEPNKNKEEFAGNFPFLQMYYELLETFLTNLKLTGSALGKYISNGERSLLRSFQYVIKGFNQKFPEFDERSPIDINNEYANNISQGIKTKPYNQSYLVPFYEFYDSIEKDLDFDIRKVFQDASNKGRLNNFDINILKTTFLIRYLDNILTRNLDTVVSLSINKVEMDSDFKDKVQESLERLENNFLITRQGEEYIFLTSRESEIENEIRNFTIPNIDKQINSIARDIIFDKTLTKKVSHTYHNVTFDIKRYFNSELTKNTSDGEINLYIDSNANDKEWMSQQVSITGSYKSFEKSKEHNGCIVIELNEHKTFYDNIEYFLKTKEYIAKMDGNTNLTDIDRDILTKKRNFNKTRYKHIESDVVNLFHKVKIYVNGYEYTTDKKEPLSIVKDAIEHYVDISYNELVVAPKASKDGFELKNILENSTYLKTADEINQFAINIGAKAKEDFTENEKLEYSAIEVLKYISNPKNLKEILNHFKQKPYAWSNEQVILMLGYLYSTDKLDFKQNNSLIENEDDKIFNTLRSFSDKVTILRRITVDQNILKKAQKLAKELFNDTSYLDLKISDKDLVKKLKADFKIKLRELNKIHNIQYGSKLLPGSILRAKGINIIKPLVESEYINSAEYINNFLEAASEIQNYYEDPDQFPILFSFYKDNNGSKSIEMKRWEEMLEVFSRRSTPISISKFIKDNEKTDNASTQFKEFLELYNDLNSIKDLAMSNQSEENQIKAFSKGVEINQTIAKINKVIIENNKRVLDNLLLALELEKESIDRFFKDHKASDELKNRCFIPYQEKVKSLDNIKSNIENDPSYNNYTVDSLYESIVELSVSAEDMYYEEQDKIAEEKAEKLRQEQAIAKMSKSINSEVVNKIQQQIKDIQATKSKERKNLSIPDILKGLQITPSNATFHTEEDFNKFIEALKERGENIFANNQVPILKL